MENYKQIPRCSLGLDSVRRVIILVSVNISCYINLSIGTCWGCFIWNHPSEYFVLLCICICLGTKCIEVLWWQIPQFSEESEEGLWACCKCKLSPSLVSGSVTRSRLLTLSQLLLATCNLCFLPKSLCSVQASHLTVVRRLCVSWIFYLPSGWQWSTEHTYGPVVPQTIIYQSWKGHLLLFMLGWHQPFLTQVLCYSFEALGGSSRSYAMKLLKELSVFLPRCEGSLQAFSKKKDSLPSQLFFLCFGKWGFSSSFLAQGIASN